MIGMTNLKRYSVELDVLKAISIIAVVFYHIGWLQTGYLGVDIFFVINGFLILPSLVQQIGGGNFLYINWLLRRTLRLWPLVLIASLVCMTVGAIGMLPDANENLAQSVIASDFMSNNILSAITTRNYWDSVNDYKPLMHMWYIGILVEFYIVIPLILLGVKKFCKILAIDFRKVAISILYILFVISLIAYLLPTISESDKFYFLPFRLFELIAGGLVGIYIKNEQRKDNIFIGIAATTLLIITLCSSFFLLDSSGDIQPVNGQILNSLLVPKYTLLLATVFLSCVACRFCNWNIHSGQLNKLAFIGKLSFSIFVWHQILLAFYRYFISSDMSFVVVIGLWTATILLSLMTYYTVEQKIKPNWKTFGACCVLLVITVLSSFWIYHNAGVVRDVPELGVYKGAGSRGMFAEYCDRVYGYDKDFLNENNGKINVLVEGVSFGRDFANILLESEWIDRINLSYIYRHNLKYAERYAQADYIFTFSNKVDIPDYVWDNIGTQTKMIGIGTKNYGNCNGVVYSNRDKDDYFAQTIKINPNFYIVNNQWKESWGEDNYVDMLEYSTAPNGEILVFTDERKFISQDCRHLTQDGAKFLAKRINFTTIFNNHEF